MAKDRLEALRELVKSNGKDKLEEPASQPQPETKKELTLRQFFAEVEEIREMIDNFQANVEEVKLRHSAILSASESNEKMSNELENLTANIKITANKTRRRLKQIEQDIKVEEEKQSNKSSRTGKGADGCSLITHLYDYESPNLRMRKSQHATLSCQFVEVMGEYNRAQVDYRDRCKTRILRQLQLTGQNISKQELDTLLEQNNPAVFTNGILMETQQAKQTLADIEARYADIVKLETSIRELDDMFTDMAMLVDRQGEMTNRIQFHVENTVDYIDNGVDDLKDTEDIKNKARRKKIIMVCLLIVVLAVVLAMIMTRIF